MRSAAKIFFLIMLVSFSLGFIKQDRSSRLVIKTRLDYFAIDNIGNIYTVKDEELVKYLPVTGKFFARYSNLKLGNISNIDATNPLKLLLYYRDFQQIVFLDDQLTQNSESISLESLGYEQTDQACAGANNSFWIYNKQNNELVRFNENTKKVASTGNLKQVLRADITPNFMLEHNGYLFLNCPETGIYVFDIFGAFSKVISIKDLKQFQVSENIIYFKKDSALCSYDYKIFEEACKQIPYASKTSELKFSKNKVYCGFKDSLVVNGL